MSLFLLGVSRGRALDRRARLRTSSLTTNLADKATDPQVYAWVQGNKNPIILGSWLFMAGCFVFVLARVASALRGSRPQREATRTAATVAYTAAVDDGGVGVLPRSPTSSPEIDADSI